MAHLIVMGYAPPAVHEKFITEVNNWRYPVKGPHRKGLMSPFVSELKFYDIRLTEEMVPSFLRDLNASSIDNLIDHLQNLKKENKDTTSLKMLRWAYGMFKKLNIFKTAEPAEGKKVYKLDSWSNFYCFGKIEDDHMENVLTKKDREVL
jgi:hypothetical protein